MGFNGIFSNPKPIIGMIHLAGEVPHKRAMEELCIYEDAGIDGAIIENYHGTIADIDRVFDTIDGCEYSIALGINVLGSFQKSFEFAEKYKCIKFIQIDAIGGNYERGTIDYNLYKSLKSKSDALVMGGVWPKYYSPIEGSNLESDLNDAKKRCEAVVVTGQGTGIQTPIEKVKNFRQLLGDFPLIIGAGINDSNFNEQMSIADACIVGSYFKGEDTSLPVIKENVEKLVSLRDELIKK